MYIRQVFQVPVQPYPANAAGTMTKEVAQGLFGEVLGGHAGHEDGVGLGGAGVVGIDEVALAEGDVPAEFCPEDVEDVKGEDPGENEEGAVAGGDGVWVNVAECEAVETLVVGDGGFDRGERHEDGPTEKPDGEQDFDHH